MCGYRVDCGREGKNISERITGKTTVVPLGETLK